MQEKLSNGNWLDQAVADQESERLEEMQQLTPEAKEADVLAAGIAQDASVVILRGREAFLHGYNVAA
ncbi:hypothetical protein CYG49_03545 [Candidatus Saccharibacteria bacterium]|nr:MAG: hypothetical protein CYG49_03545 [Candidatus Saccharibacteria bacterium]